MKKFNFIYLLLAFVGAITMTSCEHKNAEYTPGPQDQNQGVYFVSTDGFKVTAEDTFVEIPVARNNSVGAAEVKFRAEADEIFTYGDTVNFADGETVATIKIEFDGSALVVGQKYNIKIQLDQAEATAYAISEYTFSVMIPEPWSDWGAGIYVDDFWRDIMALAGQSIPAGFQSEVQFQKHDANPNLIRVVNPASIDVFANMWGGAPGFLIFDDTQDYYITFDVTDPNNVKLLENPTMLGLAINFSDGAVPACLYVPVNEDGTTGITYVDGVIRFPQGQVLLGIIDGGSLYMATGALSNVDGMLMYITPGTEITDYSMAVAYAGMKVSADNTSAKALIEFAFGEDVEEYAFTIADGDITADFAEELAAVIDGTDEEAVKASVEQTNWEIGGLAPGLYTIVAVPYAGGEAKADDAIAYSFYFNGVGDMPEVNVDVELGVPAELVDADRAEDVAKKSPACFNIGVKITADASQLKSIKYFVGNGPAVDNAIAAGQLTLDELFAEPYGGNVPASWMEGLAENGTVVGAFPISSGVKATVFLRFETIYGSNIDVRKEYTVPEYDGNFPVGAYKLTEGDYSLIFTIYPGKSYTQFFWENTSIDESTWYVSYDEEKSILTMDGTEYMYESYGNQFGTAYGYTDQSKQFVYSYISSATADFKDPTAPLQMQVGEDSLEKLLTYYAAEVIKTADESLQGYLFSFTPEATITPYVESEETPEATALAFSVTPEEIATYVVAGERVERGVVIKPYYGKIERNFQLTTLQR